MSSNQYKILVTGVAGFLGSHLSEKLSSLGHKVIGIDNMMGGYQDNIPKEIEFHNIDCCDFEKVKNICDFLKQATTNLNDENNHIIKQIKPE